MNSAPRCNECLHVCYRRVFRARSFVFVPFCMPPGFMTAAPGFEACRLRLQAAQEALTPLRGSPEAAEVAKIHFAAFLAELKRFPEMPMSAIVELSGLISASGCWPQPCGFQLLETLAARCKKSRRDMQNFENLAFYLTGKK